MRIAFVADLRSPIARPWIQAVERAGHDVCVASTRLVDPQAFCYPVANVPVGPEAAIESLLARRRQGSAPIVSGPANDSGGASGRAKVALRRVAPAGLRLQQRGLQQAIRDFHPDLVHAMRIPFEGMATALAAPQAATVVSVWGNDFTLHASQSRGYGRATRRTLQRISGLHTDCHRDRRLAVDWGFDANKSTLVAPGSGGIDVNTFCTGESTARAKLGIPENALVIINPRGVRQYVHLAEFFAAIKLLLPRYQELHVICVGLAGHLSSETARDCITEKERIHMLPPVAHHEMLDLYRAADVTSSLTSHDGTPNSLLEAMAVGCFPVVGEVQSVLEWITSENNGLAVAADDPTAIANAFDRAVADAPMRRRAARTNRSLIRERADASAVLPEILSFYEKVLGSI